MTRSHLIRHEWKTRLSRPAALAALALFAGITGEPDKGLLIAEAVAVWGFAASWLMKGAELDILLGRS